MHILSLADPQRFLGLSIRPKRDLATTYPQIIAVRGFTADRFIRCSRGIVFREEFHFIAEFQSV